MESAKECVTTHLPNQPALKMDGAGAMDLYRTDTASCVLHSVDAVSSRRAAVVSVEAVAVRRGGAATGADLGSSSKYSSESLED